MSPKWQAKYTRVPTQVEGIFQVGLDYFWVVETQLCVIRHGRPSWEFWS